MTSGLTPISTCTTASPHNGPPFTVHAFFSTKPPSLPCMRHLHHTDPISATQIHLHHSPISKPHSSCLCCIARPPLNTSQSLSQCAPSPLHTDPVSISHALVSTTYAHLCHECPISTIHTSYFLHAWPLSLPHSDLVSKLQLLLPVSDDEFSALPERRETNSLCKCYTKGSWNLFVARTLNSYVNPFIKRKHLWL